MSSRHEAQASRSDGVIVSRCVLSHLTRRVEAIQRAVILSVDKEVSHSGLLWDVTRSVEPLIGLPMKNAACVENVCDSRMATDDWALASLNV
jgi:hypothetical protein